MSLANICVPDQGQEELAETHEVTGEFGVQLVGCQSSIGVSLANNHVLDYRREGLAETHEIGLDNGLVCGLPTQLGLGYVSLANNHVLDYGQEGLAETHEVILVKARHWHAHNNGCAH